MTEKSIRQNCMCYLYFETDKYKSRVASVLWAVTVPGTLFSCLWLTLCLMWGQVWDLRVGSALAGLHVQTQETTNYPQAPGVTLFGSILIIQVYRKGKEKKNIESQFLLLTTLITSNWKISESMMWLGL